jgi:hypothetical protein
MMSAQAMEVFEETPEKVTPDRPNDDDHKVDTRGSACDWRRITSLAFITQLPPGQVQEVETGNDVIRAIQQNQQVAVLGRQDTTALGQITISSREDAIFVTAKTQIVLEVGKSKIVMANDGTIKIIGVNIETEAAEVNKIVGKQKVDINPRGSTEIVKKDPPPSGPSTLDLMFRDRLGPEA